MPTEFYVPKREREKPKRQQARRIAAMLGGGLLLFGGAKHALAQKPPEQTLPPRTAVVAKITQMPSASSGEKLKELLAAGKQKQTQKQKTLAPQQAQKTAVKPATRAETSSVQTSTGVLRFPLKVETKGKTTVFYDWDSYNAYVNGLVYERAVKHGVDPRLLNAIVQHESGFNPFARGSSGDKGLAQLTPIALKEVMQKTGIKVTNPYDLYQNLDASAALLKIIRSNYVPRVKGAPKDALTRRILILRMYNKGPVGKWSQALAKDDYARKVMRHY